MKKFYFLLTMLLGLSSLFAQEPILSAIADGDCTGGNPKMVEIFAEGTVDFSLYSLERQSNGGDWTATTNLAEFGTVTDDYVYVYSDSNDPEIFAQEFSDAVNVWENSVVNVNGDDGIRIVRDSDGAVIDQFGANGVDGTGTAWEYTDGYARRNNGSGPDGVFIETNWSYGLGLFDGQGICQGGEAFQDIMGGISNFTPTGATTEPQIAIVEPANGSVLPLGTTSVSVEFVVNHFVVGQPGAAADGHIHYTLDDGETIMHFTEEPIQLTGLTSGEHTILVWLVDNDHNPLDPEVTDTSTFFIPGTSTVENVAELRAGSTDGSVYTLSGQVLLTMQQSYRNQKWVEDSTGGILIDDPEGVITTTYNRYDGITGLSGTLTEFRGVLQFKPLSDPGAATSTGNTLVPQTVTIEDFNANPDLYESELIKIDYISTDATGNWETGTNYNFVYAGNGGEPVIVRTNFYDADYIGTAIPNYIVDIVGIASEYEGTAQWYPRDSDDIMETLSVNDIRVNAANVKVALSSNTLHINGFQAQKVSIYNMNGQLVGNSVFVGNLNAGTYIAVLKNAEGQMVSVKFIKK